VQTLILPTRRVAAATPRTRIIVADLGDREFPFAAGQAVFAGLADGTVRRPYSIACSPQYSRREKAIELLVQVDDAASPDPHLELADAGTRLRIEGPFGSFGLPSPLAERRLLLVAGGTGIAPLRSILWDTLEREPDVAITLIYSARAPEEFAFLEELGSLESAQRLELVLTVTRQSASTWTGSRGRIDQALMTATLKTAETRCLLCGPSAFVADVTALLADAGVPPDRIVTETYAA
jgi:CDP-4-dehydro-6-deoxyglucose reductase